MIACALRNAARISVCDRAILRIFSRAAMAERVHSDDVVIVAATQWVGGAFYCAVISWVPNTIPF